MDAREAAAVSEPDGLVFHGIIKFFAETAYCNCRCRRIQIQTGWGKDLCRLTFEAVKLSSLFVSRMKSGVYGSSVVCIVSG